ncbi:hypothetical protein [Bacillus rhizoplanae]|uniref:hypothetical protein n=1 Tax=Bacillus rhizoplanae TaxID=2880966 RepID=UPI003D2362B1
MKKYALLYAGCISKQYNHDRYQNDLAFMYSVLQQNNYDQIDVLYYDGSLISFSGQPINTLEGSKSNFLSKLTDYKLSLEDNDLLFIMISNHGGIANGLGLINCLGTETIGQREFANQLSDIKGNKVIVLGQCFGGNFLLESIPNSIMISANEINKVSFGALNGSYDEFLYHFISFYNNGYPNGTPLRQPKTTNSVLSAFTYAKNNDYFLNCQLTYYNDLTSTNEFVRENPQFKHNLCDPNINLL